jgi:hypothetical protein
MRIQSLAILALAPTVWATPVSSSFLDDKDFGVITFDNTYHTPLVNGGNTPVKCGQPTAGIREGFSFGPDMPFDLKAARPGSVTTGLSATQLCFATNSSTPCFIRAVTVSNSTWGTVLNVFPGGSSTFENCYQKGSVAITQGYRACLDLRLLQLAHGTQAGRPGMFMSGPRGDFGTLMWRCDDVGDANRGVLEQ